MSFLKGKEDTIGTLSFPNPNQGLRFDTFLANFFLAFSVLIYAEIEKYLI